jgi:acetolactate synthase-1/2/3 large subunit
MNGAESLIKTAAASGIQVCFANFGTTEVTLVAALDSMPGIRAVPALFEGVCTGAADGYARMSDKPAMVLLHLGLGLANALANLHNARRARTSLFAVVGEHATWHQLWDSPEATDIKGLATPVAGFVRACASAETVSQDTVDAISAAARGQVAVLIVPQDCQWTECSGLIAAMPHISSDPVDEANVRHAAALLGKSSKALLFLGGNALRRTGLLASARIREATGCDVLAETFVARLERGGGLLPVNRLPYFPEQAAPVLSRYDVVVLAGSREPVATFAYKGGKSKMLNDNQRVFTIAEGNQNIEEVLEALADLLSSPQKAGPKIDAGIPLDRASLCKGRLTPETVGRTLAALQPERAIIVEEAITSAGPYFEFSSSLPAHTVLTLTGGAIGQGMPNAVGAAIACPDRPVINLQGDGSAMYTVQALWTQAHQGLNITTLICANRSYDILKLEMARGGYVPLGFSAQVLTDLAKPSIDWVQVGSSMGVPGVSVETAEDLAKELTNALEEAGPHLIEMKLSL